MTLEQSKKLRMWGLTFEKSLKMFSASANRNHPMAPKERKNKNEKKNNVFNAIGQFIWRR